MRKLIRPRILPAIMLLILTACSFPGTAQNNVLQATPGVPAVVTIELTVQADTSAPFNAVGQVIKYNLNVKNVSSVSTPGPVVVTGTTAVCPEITTVGDLNNTLDANETLVCTSSYTIAQADLDNGAVTNVVTVSVNGVNSNPVTTTVPTVKPVALTLTKSAAPATYAYLGQGITYTYVITNVSAATVGPAQFTVTDTGISTPINCGEATLSLASNSTVTCSATYVITQADMDAATVTTNATAAGGGAGSSQPASAAITKAASPSLTAGSTINHQVTIGEWVWQIARCYGADPQKVSDANPPTPAEISPDMTVTVPNIGSDGKIYGPPCVVTHKVQTDDTWASIALRYNADVEVLKLVNSNTLTVGSVLKIPLNSASVVKP